MVHRSMRVAKCHTRSQIVKNRGHADASGQETVVRCNFTMQPLRKSILANACKTARCESHEQSFTRKSEI